MEFSCPDNSHSETKKHALSYTTGHAVGEEGESKEEER